MRPEFKNNPAQISEVHKLQTKDKTRLHEAKRGKQQSQKSFMGDKQGKPRRESCFNCGAKPSHPRSECENALSAEKKIIMVPYAGKRVEMLE